MLTGADIEGHRENALSQAGWLSGQFAAQVFDARSGNLMNWAISSNIRLSGIYSEAAEFKELVSMLTFYVKVPIGTNPSSIEWVTPPTMITGEISPVRVKGVTTVCCPRCVSRMAPPSIGQSCLSGKVDLMFEYILVVATNSSWASLLAMWTISITSSTRSLLRRQALGTLSVSHRGNCRQYW